MADREAGTPPKIGNIEILVITGTANGNYLGFADLDLSSTNRAKFGKIVANQGVYYGKQILPAGWV